MAKRGAAAAPKGGGLPKAIVLHASETMAALDLARVERDLQAAAPGLPALTRRGDIAAGPGARGFCAQLAGSRVRDTVVADSFLQATSSDLDFEAAIDSAPEQVQSALLARRLYDGNRVAALAMLRLPPGERTVETLHVWVTRRLLGTYGAHDMRYHARYAVFAYPVVFSLLGLGLAPAPTLEAALFSRELARRGADAQAIEAELDRQYPEEKVDIDDKGTVSRAVASTVLQGAAALSGASAFCKEPTCRLFNPHRKVELRRSLLEGALCAEHAAFFRTGGQGA